MPSEIDNGSMRGGPKKSHMSSEHIQMSVKGRPESDGRWLYVTFKPGSRSHDQGEHIRSVLKKS